jgi:ribonuclease HI
MFKGQHWPLDWNGNTITEATVDNPTGWYKVIRDKDGNVISYHPTLGTIVQRYNDGNIRVPKTPRDSRDAASKAYVDSSSLNAPGIGTYGFVYRGSNGFGSVPFCSDDAPKDEVGGIRANTAAVRTSRAELLCNTTDSSKPLAAVNKKYFTEKTKEYILESANTYIKSKEGTDILIDDLKDGITKIEVSTLPNSTIRACAPVVYEGKQEVSSQEPYSSKYIDIYPPRR